MKKKSPKTAAKKKPKASQKRAGGKRSKPEAVQTSTTKPKSAPASFEDDENVVRDILARLSKRMKKKRQELGYTSGETFAYDKGLNRSQYAGYEAGDDLYFSTLVRVIRRYGISLKEFFSEGFD
jgi:hypothetical protein